MAESKIEDMDLIKVVDKEEVLNDPTTSMKKVEDKETQEVSNKNESELNDSYENDLKVVAVIDVKKQESSLDSENSNNIENTMFENEKHTKEDVTMNARLKEMDNEENPKQVENSSLKVKDIKNTVSEEEETLNEILKVVHENLGSTEVRQFATEPKNLEQENKSVHEETKEPTDRESKKEDVVETTNDDTDVLIINESVSSRRNSDTKQSMEVEHMEVGIVGPPTTVSELINEEELRAESALSTDQKVEVHVAEWVQNSAKAEELVGDEEETPINDTQQEKKNVKEKRTRKKKSNDVLNLPSRKSQRIVSNIIKKSIKCRLRRGAVPTIGVPVNVQPVTKMLVEDAKRSLLKVTHAKMLTGQKVIGKNGLSDSKQQHHQPATERRQQQHHHQHQQRAKSGNQVNQEQKMAGIDVLLALGLKPAPRLNKMHAMEGAAGNGKKVDSAEKTRDDESSRSSPKVPQSQQNGAALPEETAAAPTTIECLRSTSIKKEPLCDSEPEVASKSLSSAETMQQKPVVSRCTKSETEGSRKRKSTDGQLSSNGNSTPKKFCTEQREQYISSLVGCEKVTAEELAARADQLRAEVQALDELARAKEMEWNEILSMRKLKEEAYLRIERRRQVMGFMEGNGQLADTLPPASLALGPEWESSGNTTPVSKEKLSFGSKEDLPEESSQDSPAFKREKGSKQASQRQSTPPKQSGENGRKQAEALSPENRQIGEGRQGAIVDVRSIIADYRLRHPETVPRRGRRMRNSVNVGLGAGGAMVETGHNVDSRPSSTDSCKSNSNTVDPNNSMSFKDVLVQFAKLSQQQGEPVKTPQNYPDVTLHPVAPSPAPQNTPPQQSGSLLHGILTKSQSPRPTTFSPTLARLLTAPERERNAPTTASMPQQSAATQHLLQTYQGSNPVSISDLLSSSKARTEITITPVINTPVQSHVDDVEEESAVIEDRETRISSGGRDAREDRDSPPRCQGCHERVAQFVCAGCGHQWYCSRECQVAAWDEHSEVCSG